MVRLIYVLICIKLTIEYDVGFKNCKLLENMTIMGSTTWAKHKTKQADFKESACFSVSIYREALNGCCFWY